MAHSEVCIGKIIIFVSLFVGKFYMNIFI